MAVTKIANQLGGTTVSFDLDDDNFIGKIFDPKRFSDEVARKAEIEEAIEIFTSDDLDAILANVGLLEDTITTLVGKDDTDMSEKLKEYTDKFKDQQGNILDEITSANLADFIMEQWN
jgi:hypothetical protein